MSSTDKVVSVFLKFGADQQSIEKSIAEFKKIQAEMVDLENTAKALKADIATALEQGNNADELTAELKTIEGAISNLRKKADSELGDGLSTSLKKVTESAKQTGASVGQSFNLRDIGEKLNMVGGAIANAGMSINNMVMGSVNTYLATAGAFDQSAARWNTAQKEMQNSYTRIGAVALKELLPTIETIAKLTEEMADFIEKNPWIVKAAIGTGGTLLVVGKITQLVAQFAIIVGVLQQLVKLPFFANILPTAGSAVTGASNAAGAVVSEAGAAGAVAAAPIAAIIGGVLAGLGVNELMARNGGPNATTGQLATTGAYELGGIFGKMAGIDEKEIERKSQVFAAIIGKITGAIDENSPLWQKAKNSVPKKADTSTFASDNWEMFADFEKQKAEAAQQYADQVKEAEAQAEKQRIKIIEDFAKQAAKAEADFAKERDKAQRDFNKSQAQAARDHAKQTTKAAADFARAEDQEERKYYAERKKAARDFGLEAARMEEDHQREMARLQQGHNRNVKKLIGDRDALGLVDEQQSYEDQRRQAEENYNLEASRKREDYARQMADMEASFAEARAQRLADFQRTAAENEAQYQEQRAQRARDFAEQQKERAAQHAEQMAQMKAQKDEQLKQLDDSTREQLAKLKSAYDKQAETMQTAFVDRLNVLSKSIQGDTDAWKKYMEGESAKFEAWLKSKGYKPPVVDGKKAGGGSVYDGLSYLVGEQGPEIFQPNGNGRIIPADMTASMLNSNSTQGSRTNTTVLNFYLPSGATLTETRYTQADKNFILQTLAEEL